MNKDSNFSVIIPTKFVFENSENYFCNSYLKNSNVGKGRLSKDSQSGVYLKESILFVKKNIKLKLNKISFISKNPLSK